MVVTIDEKPVHGLIPRIFSSGGTVRFESAENKGTTIFVTLPLGGCTAIQGEKSLA